MSSQQIQSSASVRAELAEALKELGLMHERLAAATRVELELRSELEMERLGFGEPHYQASPSWARRARMSEAPTWLVSHHEVADETLQVNGSAASLGRCSAAPARSPIGTRIFEKMVGIRDGDSVTANAQKSEAEDSQVVATYGGPTMDMSALGRSVHGRISSGTTEFVDELLNFNEIVVQHAHESSAMPREEPSTELHLGSPEAAERLFHRTLVSRGMPTETKGFSDLNGQLDEKMLPRIAVDKTAEGSLPTAPFAVLAVESDAGDAEDALSRLFVPDFQRLHGWTSTTSTSMHAAHDKLQLQCADHRVLVVPPVAARAGASAPPPTPSRCHGCTAAGRSGHWGWPGSDWGKEWFCDSCWSKWEIAQRQ